MKAYFIMSIGSPTGSETFRSPATSKLLANDCAFKTTKIETHPNAPNSLYREFYREGAVLNHNRFSEVTPLFRLIRAVGAADQCPHRLRSKSPVEVDAALFQHTPTYFEIR